MEAQPAVDKPWHVRTDSGVFHTGFDDDLSAASGAALLNKRAEQLGLQTRYVVAEKQDA